MGTFIITNNSSAVLTKISSITEADNAFTIISGTLPLYKGNTLSGTHIEINDDKGEQFGTINLFFIENNSKITYSINGSEIFTNKLYGSGFAEVSGPVVAEGDSIEIIINEAEPQPTPQPSSTPSLTQTPTPSTTSSPGLTPSATPAETPSSTPAETPTPTESETPTPTPSETPSATPNETPTPTVTSSPSNFDADAAAYLAEVLLSGGTLDATASGATNTLFTELKSNGLWDGMIYMYPFLGGNDGGQSVEAKLNYNLEFVGGWTHDASGATSNGINAYAETNWIPSGTTGLNISGGTFGIYVGEDVTADATRAFGCNYYMEDIEHVASLSLSPKFITGNIQGEIWEGEFGNEGGTVSNSTGLFAIGKTGDTNTQLWYRDTIYSNLSSTPYGLPDRSLYLGALHFYAGGNQYSNYKHQFDFGHTGMTESQYLIFNQLVQDFQSTLGRNSY